MATSKEKQREMSTSKEKQHLPSPGGVSCSICLEAVESIGERSVARLKCGHQFHLDCIGSAFNAKGAMQCPNCRQVEGGQWLYASGCFLQQQLLRNANLDEDSDNYAGIHYNMVYLHDERFGQTTSRRPSQGSYRHIPVSHVESDYSINSYPHLTTHERQHQRAPWLLSGETVTTVNPGFDPGWVAASREVGPWSVPSNEVARPLAPDVDPPYASGMYVQSSQPMVPRAHEWPHHGSMLQDPSHMLEGPVSRRRMDGDGSTFQYGAAAGLSNGHRHYTNRGASDRGIALNPSQLHLLPGFRTQGPMSNLEQSQNSQFQDARYGQAGGSHNARRVGTYPSRVSTGHEWGNAIHQDPTSGSFATGYNGYVPHFSSLNRAINSRGYDENRIGTRIPWL